MMGSIINILRYEMTESKLRCKFGFTLAEVLVTLGIIGVISALTLPTLVKNHQRQVFVTQLKKSYAVISQGIEAIMKDKNAVRFSETRLCMPYENIDKDAYIATLRRYFKTIDAWDGNEKVSHEYMSCTYNEAADTYSNCTTNGGSATYDGIQIILADGEALNFFPFGNILYISVDVNGEDLPNTWGRDYFRFYVDCAGSGEVIPTNGHGGPGAQYIIENGWKMDY